LLARSRRPEIMADAAVAILSRDARSYTGNFVTDEQVLREEGCVDFTRYNTHPDQELELDIFVAE
jgi:citronellol/citronellal dehydrogenase